MFDDILFIEIFGIFWVGFFLIMVWFWLLLLIYRIGFIEDGLGLVEERFGFLIIWCEIEDEDDFEFLFKGCFL